MSGSSTPRNASSILSKPLYAYSLPPQLLDILTLRSLQAPPPPEPEAVPAATETTTGKEQLGGDRSVGSSLTCQTCGGAQFTSLDEQRAHFKGDWHRYNAKVGLGKVGTVVTEQQFEQMNDGLSSLSGTASSDGDEDSEQDGEQDGDGDDDKISRMLRKQRLQQASAGLPTLDEADELDAEQAEYRRRAEMRTAMIWFRPRKDLDPPQQIVPDDTQLGIYRALLPNHALGNPSELLPALRNIQLDPNDRPEDPSSERKITLLMVAGGHFAGMIVGLRPLQSAGKGVKPEKQHVKGAGEVRVIQHKTFHRYTTRKKQGGSQGDNDNAKGKANSAGAMLRRYGEQSLREEIQALMLEWADELRTSERIFLRTSASGRRSFFGFEGAPVDKADPRIKVFPFPTRRPTLSELLRCFSELTRVKVSHLSEEAIRALEEAYIASLQPKTRPTPVAAPQPVVVKESAPKLSPEEEARLDRKHRLVDMVRKGRMEPLPRFWERHYEEFGGVDALIDEGEDGQTMLMIAAESGQEDVVRWLLETLRANPTIVDRSGGNKTAYDLASTKGVRNIFRRLAHDHPDWYDWIGAGHVPSGLSEEKEAEQDKKRADRRKGLKEKAKEREAKRAESAPKVVEEVPTPSPILSAVAQVRSGPQKLGGGTPGQQQMAGLTPEMRQRIERERRARAAEARLAGGSS